MNARMERAAMALSVTGSLNKCLDLSTRASTFAVAPLYTTNVMVRTRSVTFSYKSFLRLSSPRHRLPAFLVRCSKEDDNHEFTSSENVENPISWQQKPDHSHDEETSGSSTQLPYSSPSSSHSSTSDGAASRQSTREMDSLRRENSELRTALAALSKSLASISTSLNEVSHAVQLVANAVELGPSHSGVPEVPTTSEPPAVDLTELPRNPLNMNIGQELQHSTENSWQDIVDNQVVQDPVQARLLEQNMKAHKLAYRLQQAFVQARIEGIGKPFQLAAEDFVVTCLEAHAAGFGLKELQLQLILLEGSLTGVFAIRDQRYSDDPVMDEESRVRSSWVRLVYTTLDVVRDRRSRVDNVDGISGGDKDHDPSDVFVKEVVRVAYEEGYDLERLKLEQSVTGPSTSSAMKTMRQSTYLILLTLEKATNDTVQF